MAMPGAPPTTCPDCDGSLRAVRLLDTSGLEFPQHHKELRYASLESKKSFWTGRFPVEGMIRGLLCESCGRVRLYAVPAGQEDPHATRDP